MRPAASLVGLAGGRMIPSGAGGGGGVTWLKATSAVHEHERRDFLLHFVFENLEVLAFEVRDELPAIVPDDDVRRDQVDSSTERGLTRNDHLAGRRRLLLVRLGLRLRLRLRRLLRGGTPRKQADGQDSRKRQSPQEHTGIIPLRDRTKGPGRIRRGLVCAAGAGARPRQAAGIECPRTTARSVRVHFSPRRASPTSLG